MKFWIPAAKGVKTALGECVHYAREAYVSLRDLLGNMLILLIVVTALPFMPIIRNAQALRTLIRDIKKHDTNLENCKIDADFAYRARPLVDERLAVFPYSKTYKELKIECANTIALEEKRLKEELDELKAEIGKSDL